MPLITTLEKDGKKFISVLEAAATDTEKVIAGTEKYLPEATAIAEALFPQFAPEIAAGSTTFASIADLISKTVLSVQQKAAALPAGLTSEQKAAEVLSIVSASVISALKAEKITAGTSYVASLVSAVVALLDVPTVSA